MSKFNTASTRAAVASPITTERTASGRTFEGAPGFARDLKSETFLLAVTNMVGEQTFYENAETRDNRYAELIRNVAVVDPDWTARFLAWLRSSANMRSAALVGGLEAAKALIAAGIPGGRQIVASVLQRPDEPGEALAYWTSTYGRAIPKAIKRGIGDAAARLYSERSVLKWDTASKGYRFGDVLNLTHAAAKADWQADLYRHILDRRYGRDSEVPELLRMISGNRDLRARAAENPAALLDADALREAGMTWEDALSLAGSKVNKARLWEALIPSMGIMALARNLRNFDEAGVSDAVAGQVNARFADADQFATSRMFPFRWWAAYKHAPSLRWAHALEQAVNHSLANVPALDGRTLILVDRSPSMFPGFYFSTVNSSDITLAEQAAIFGAAIALRAANPTLVEFGGSSNPVEVPKGGSVLKLVERFGQIDGTDIPSAVKRHFDRHDRVVIVTDEQTRPGWLPSNMYGHGGAREALIDDLIPKEVPVYMWNLAGYKPGAMPSGSSGRHTFGGLTDAGFQMIPLLEAGRNADWPF